MTSILRVGAPVFVHQHVGVIAEIRQVPSVCGPIRVAMEDPALGDDGAGNVLLDFRAFGRKGCPGVAQLVEVTEFTRGEWDARAKRILKASKPWQLR